MAGFGKRLFESTGKDQPRSTEKHTSRSPKRRGKLKEAASGMAKTSVADREATPSDEDELATEELVGTPTKRIKARKDVESVNGHWDHGEAVDSILFTTRSSGRTRRRPRKLTDDDIVLNDTETDVVAGPKGILTPSKSSRQKRGRINHKRVAFQSEPTEDELRIEDFEVPPPLAAKNHEENTLLNGHNDVDDFQVGDEPMAVIELFEEPNPVPEAKIVFEDLDPEIDKIKSVLLSRLTHKSLTPLAHLSSEYQKIHSLISKTVASGEGNSMLVLGSRGTGKRTLVETALMELQQEHRHEFHTIRLNGLFHNDDKLALREIWRQFGREMERDEEENKAGSYADTLSSLLALLSHPDDFEISTDKNHPPQNGQGHKTSKSVIFIMEEFDVFASHSRQTLLYNLFDIAQARKAPIAVIGLSTRMDVADSLEKRVKSRFSQRHVFVPQARNLEAFNEICKTCLRLSSTDKSHDEEKLDEIYVTRWNKWIDQLFSKDRAMQRHLSIIYTSSKSVPEFQQSCLVPISTLRALIDKSSCTGTQTGPLPTGEEFLSSAQSLRPPDSVLTELPSLTDVQLALLIAAARLDLIYGGGGTDGVGVNFESVYAEYVRLTSESRIASSASGAAVSSRVWGKEVTEGPWEELTEKGILIQAGKADMYKIEVLLEEIVPGVEVAGGRVPDDLRRWCKDL